jgi:hypothetical protein
VGIPDPAEKLFPAAPAVTAALGANVAVPELYVNLYVEGRYRGEQNPVEFAFRLSNRDESYVLPSGYFLDLSVTTLGLRLWSAPGASQTDDLVLCARATNIFGERPAQTGVEVFDLPSMGRGFFVGLRAHLD